MVSLMPYALDVTRVGFHNSTRYRFHTLKELQRAIDEYKREHFIGRIVPLIKPPFDGAEWEVLDEGIKQISASLKQEKADKRRLLEQAGKLFLLLAEQEEVTPEQQEELVDVVLDAYVALGLARHDERDGHVTLPEIPTLEPITVRPVELSAPEFDPFLVDAMEEAQ